MYTIKLQPSGANQVVERLTRITKRRPIRVEVQGKLPEDSEYARCLQRGSLPRLEGDDRAAVDPGPDILSMTTHVWGQGGVLAQ